MIRIKDYQLEPFLSQYYFITGICADFVGAEERRSIYNRLASVFCLPECGELEEYFRLSESREFIAVTDKASYERLCRTIDFATNSGQDIELTEQDRTVLSCKSVAVNIRKDIFDNLSKLTRESLVTILLDKANMGNVDAMAALSFMEYNGICMHTDAKNAVKRLRLCARWNNLFANLLGIACDEENTENYFNNLYTVMNTEDRRRRFLEICNYHGYTAIVREKAEAKILEKAFGVGIVKRNVFERAVEKIVYSPVLTVEDKEALFLSGNKDVSLLLADIPADMIRGERSGIEIDRECGKNLVLVRENEQRRILQSLAIATGCPEKVYKPLLVVASDAYICDMYEELVKTCVKGTAFVDVDASTVSEADLLPNKDNVFLRGLTQTKTTNTVFVIHNLEALEEREGERLIRFLDTGVRKRFRLSVPSVTVDLSGIMFVMLANETTKVVREVSDVCDTVWTEHISGEEKQAAIVSMFRRASAAYGHEIEEPDRQCLSYLVGFDLDRAEQIIDGTIRNAVFEGKNKICIGDLMNVGRDGETKRGFGYMGGYNNA